MDIRRILAIVLLTGGILALVYRGFNYTSETHKASIGPLDLSVKEKEHVDIPVWAGVAAVVVGAVLLIPSRRKS